MVCPTNLEFDSEPSSGAEWSFSMVTPTTRLTVQESPSSFASTTTTEEDEEGEEYPTTDESVLELRNALNTGAKDTSSKKKRRSSLKFHMKAKKGGRSVVRTLFPARSPAIGVAVKPSDVSPHAHPLEVCSSSPFVLNIRKEVAVAQQQQVLSCSQELFGTPAGVVPASRPTSPTAETQLVSDGGGETIESVNFVRKTPTIPHKIQHNGYLLVHSTPLSTDQSRSCSVSSSIYDIQPGKLDVPTSPKISSRMTASTLHQEPSCLSATPDTALTYSSVVAETPCKNADIYNRPERFSFRGGGEGEDVLDVLFMSSSELESHFNLQDSQRHTAETVGTNSTEVQPSNGICVSVTTLADQLPKETEEKDNVASADKKMQVNHFLYSNSKKRNHRRSRVRTRVGTCTNKVSNSGNALLSSSSSLCTKKRVVDERDQSRIGPVLGEPLAKKQCAAMEGKVDEESGQESSDEDDCEIEIETDCCGDGNNDQQGHKTKEQVKENQNEMEVTEEEEEDGGGAGVVTRLDQDPREERDGQVSMDVGEVSDSIMKEYQHFVDDSEIAVTFPEESTKNESLDERPKISQPVIVKEVEADLARQVDFTSLGKDTHGKDEAKVSTLDTVTLSPIPVIKMRHMRVPGLRRSAQKQPTKSAVQIGTCSGPIAENVPLVSTTPIPASCISERSSFVGFKTAAGSSIQISTAALDKAKKRMDTEFEDAVILDGEAQEHMDISYQSVETKTDTLETNVTNSKQSVSFGPRVPPKYQTPNSSTTFPCSSFLRRYPSGSATYPHKKGPTMKRQGTKGFRAPRMASDVSKEEESESLSRILKGFGVSTTNSSLLSSGFDTGSGKKLTISHNAMLKARELFSDDNERVSNAQTNTNIYTGEGKGRNGLGDAPLHEDLSVTGFQTAGGKGILVSSKAFERVQELVAEVSPKVGGFESRIGVAEQFIPASTATGFKTAGGKGISVSFNALKRAQEMVAEEIQTVCGLEAQMQLESVERIGTNEPPAYTATGFKTAAGGAIAVSLESLRRAEMTDGDRTVGYVAPGEPPLNIPEQYSLCKPVSRDVDMSIVKMMSNNPVSGIDDSSSCYFSTQVVRQLLNFSSEEESSAEDVILNNGDPSSDKIDSHSRKMEDEAEALGSSDHVDSSLQALPLSQQQRETECYNLSESVVGHMETSSINSWLPFEDSPCPKASSQLVCESFSVPVTTPVNVSLTSPSKCMEESADGRSPPPTTHVHLCVGQNTAAPVEEEGYCQSKQSKPVPAGCTAAGGRNADISSAALKTVESNLVSPPHNVAERSSECASVLAVEVHAELGQNYEPDEAKDKCSPGSVSPSSGDDREICRPSVTYLSLQTASGKKVEMSKEAIKEAKVTLGCITATLDSQTHHQSCPDLLAASEVVILSKESLSANKAVWGASDLEVNSFQTASGKRVEISEESIRAAKVFLREPRDQQLSPMNSSQMASGEKVELCENFIGEAKPKLGEPCGEEVSYFSGFQTSSGAKVDKSEESIRADKTALGDPGNERVNSLCGFQTASGKKVDVSEESIRAVETILGEPSNERVNSFCGFQTAGGREVKICEESIRAAKASFVQTPDTRQHSNLFPSLQTASGKHVDINEQSLQAARITLGESGTSHNIQRTAKSHGVLTNEELNTGEAAIASKSALGKTSVESVLFSGLRTASGLTVDVSYRSLEQARSVIGSARASNDVYRTAESSSDPRTCLSKLHENEQISRQSRRGLTSIPECKYCIFQ